MNKSILWVNDFPPVTSGIATFFVNIWRHLPSERVLVIAPSVPEAQAIDRDLPFPVRRLSLPMGEAGMAKGVKTLLTIFYCFILSLFRRPARHHCGQVLSSGIAGWLCKKTLGIPYVVYVYGSETFRFGRSSFVKGLMRAVLEDSEVVVANSQYTAEEFISFGISSAHVQVVYPGVDPEHFRPADTDPILVEQYGLTDKRVLLTVARLDERKGHDVVIRALALLVEDHPELVYLVPGNGREEPRLRKLAGNLGLEDRIRFLGFVPDKDLPDLYNLCDIYVMPNRIAKKSDLAGDVEGFGIAFIEASACAKPVVGGRSGGAVEAVAHGETGLLVNEPDSPEAVADVVGRLLRDAELCAQLGQAGRKRVEALYDWRRLAPQVEEIL